LLLLFSFPLILPLLAITAGSEANLPACCRRNGAHHCLGKMLPATSSGTSLSAIPPRCPAFPAAITQARHNELSFPSPSFISTEIVSHPAIKPQTQARASVAFNRSHPKRGPPAQLL
jgi:hypothetical protein